MSRWQRIVYWLRHPAATPAMPLFNRLIALGYEVRFVPRERDQVRLSLYQYDTEVYWVDGNLSACLLMAMDKAEGTVVTRLDPEKVQRAEG